MVDESLKAFEAGLQGRLPQPLTHLLYPDLRSEPVDPERAIDDLTKTSNCQPTLLACGVALYRLLEQVGLKPDVVAGHSLGEYSALVASESIGFSDALRLVRLRGQAMQEAVPAGQGGMLAVAGLSPKEVSAICGADLDVAAVNSPVQAVVAGAVDALARFEQQALSAGARRCVALQVSAPFHSRMLRPAEAPLRKALNGVSIEAPKIPVFQNVTAAASSDPAVIRDNLVAQVSRTVRWADCVAEMTAAGASSFVELGPGRTLMGLIKKCDRSLKVKFTDRSGFLEQF